MAKYYHTEHIHPYSWDQVAGAIFRRYPNPFASHVLTEDTVHREVINGNLYTRRLLMKTNKIPKWGEKVLAGFARKVPLIEESCVDSRNKTITTYTRNVGMSNFMTVAERVVYKACPTNPAQTVAVKEAWVESKFYGLRTAIKNFGIERFKNNTVRATEGFNLVLERLQSQQHSLRELGTNKLHEFAQKTDNFKTQYREKADSIKEKSSAQWLQAKETAKKAAAAAAAQTTLHASEDAD